MRGEQDPQKLPNSGGNYIFAKAFGAVAIVSGLGAAVFEIAGSEKLAESLGDVAAYGAPATLFAIAYGLATRD